MKVWKFMSVAGLTAGMTAASAMGAPFGLGNLVVSRVGDGVNTLVNSAGPVSLLEYTGAGSLVQTIGISIDDLQWSGAATSEGAISLSQDKTKLTLVGYNPPFSGSGSLASRTDAQAPRTFLTVGYDGTVSAPTDIGAYSGNNLRSGVSSNTGTYFAGGNSGTIYRDTANTTIQSAVANTRVVNIINGKLYFSTASGTSRGVWTFNTALPTSAATASVLMNQGGSGDVYDFAINDAGTVAYLTNGNVVQRWTFDGSSWTLNATSSVVGAGLTGMAVAFGAGTDTIYVVNPGTLFTLSFSSGFSAATPLATAGTNYAFRGLEFAPIPEPGSLALAGLGLLLIAHRRRTA